MSPWRRETLLAVISFDGERVIVGHVDECMEHHILLSKVGLPATDIDRYFRIVFDREGRTGRSSARRITGESAIRRVASRNFTKTVLPRSPAPASGLFVDIRIPKRYQRHIKALG